MGWPSIYPLASVSQSIRPFALSEFTIKTAEALVDKDYIHTNLASISSPFPDLDGAIQIVGINIWEEVTSGETLNSPKLKIYVFNDWKDSPTFNGGELFDMSDITTTNTDQKDLILIDNLLWNEIDENGVIEKGFYSETHNGSIIVPIDKGNELKVAIIIDTTSETFPADTTFNFEFMIKAC